jgi:hypothetical protein
MTAYRPEADTEYSRATPGSKGRKNPSTQASGGSARGLSIGVLLTALVGVLLLVVAEFTPLLSLHTSAHRTAVTTVNTGSHNSYAMVPLALLAAVFSVAVWRTRNRLALLATGVLAVAALLIALLGDLPDAQATGLIGSAATHYVLATASPSTGLYLETLGAVLLLISAVAGLLLLPAPVPPTWRGKAARSAGQSNQRGPLAD